MERDRRIFTDNAAWAEVMTQEDPGCFERPAKSQSPAFLSIGCSDSRAPASSVTGTVTSKLSHSAFV